MNLFKRLEKTVDGSFEILSVGRWDKPTGMDENSPVLVPVFVDVMLRIKNPEAKPGTYMYRAYGQFYYKKGEFSTFREACPWQVGGEIPYQFIISEPTGLFSDFRNTLVRPKTKSQPALLCMQNGAILNLADAWQAILLK